MTCELLQHSLCAAHDCILHAERIPPFGSESLLFLVNNVSFSSSRETNHRCEFPLWRSHVVFVFFFIGLLPWPIGEFSRGGSACIQERCKLIHKTSTPEPLPLQTPIPVFVHLSLRVWRVKCPQTLAAFCLDMRVFAPENN